MMRSHSCVRIVLFLVGSLIMTLLGGCDSGPKISDENLVEIQANDVAELLATNRKSNVAIDPRSPMRFETGHLPDALNIPLETIGPNDPRLEGHDTLIVYGTDWNDLVPQAAGKKLLGLGYESVRVYRGGVADWVTQGRQIQHGSASAPN